MFWLGNRLLPLKSRISVPNLVFWTRNLLCMFELEADPTISGNPDTNRTADISSLFSSSQVTIEDVDDEDKDYLTVQPCQLSPLRERAPAHSGEWTWGVEAMAEEGLDNIPWDPSEDISPLSGRLSRDN
ncbi:hypothetical protein B0H10DRAFT_1944367 [Mycena sp. CBHHK59/15]|nr:hypothetical protein B0H10DRAFT_1944367 [Mycena sp. CBHHK59/15]